MLAVGVLASPVTAVAQNVDDWDIFELDGNPQDGAPAGEDWHTYFNTLNPAEPFPAGAAAAKSFIAETGNVTIFTQGGSKDVNGVAQWRHTAGSVPDKDDLQNAFAAAYIVNDQLLLYFGADRTANNGDANIGFWFFQGNVGLNPNGTFSGFHQDGDIFVVSGFTSGGQTSEIDVWEWSCAANLTPAQCDATGTLALVASGANAQCNPSSTGSFIACAIANTGSVPSVWAYTPKQGASGTFPVASFFEGGINVTQLLGTTPCLSSFIVETRSSTSNTAQLKDFMRGSFSLCGLSATKACPADGVVNPGGTSIHYTFSGTVTNTGLGALSSVTLVDTLPAGSTSAAFMKGTPAVPPAIPGAANATASIVACPAGAPAGAICADLGSLAGKAVINWTVEFDSTSLNPQNNVYAVGNVAGTSIVSDPAQATCTTTPSNSITISKNCGVPAGHLGGSPPAPATALPGTQLVTQSGLAAVQTNFSGMICNTGQTPLTGITLTDNPAATLSVAWPGTPGALAAGGQPGNCANYAGAYLPTGVTPGDLGGAAGRYSFSDEIKVTGATATLGPNPGADATCLSTFTSGAQACGAATCNICPAAATCSGP